MGLGLCRRSHLCINTFALNGNVEVNCRKLIKKLNGLKCDFYENKEFKIPSGVYDFEDLKDLGAKNGVCPYYLVRNSLNEADCIIHPYNYMVDPFIYSIISEKLPEDTFVIFDEAHNIDMHCIEALSLEINRNVLEASTRALKQLETEIEDIRVKCMGENEKKLGNLNRDYSLFKNKQIKTIEDDSIPYYFTPDFYQKEERKYEFIPGNLRNSNHFISTMKRIIEFLKTKLKTAHLTTETILSFTNSIKELTYVDRKSLQFCSHRLSILINSLNLENIDIRHLRKVAQFSTMLAVYSKGFSVIFEPYDSMADAFNPVLRLYCLDSSIAMKSIFKHFRNVVLTSGTLSPIDMYPKILNFVPSQIVEINATLERNSISPLIITKGDDQVILNYESPDTKYNSGDSRLTTSFKHRVDSSVVRNYGSLLINLSKVVPDNIVVFFPSYIYMEEIVTLWSESNIISEILKNKLVFIETPDFNETEIALKNFRNSCDNGKGAMLLSVARGKVSEGVDFEYGYGRAVVLLGMPFMYTESVSIKERLKYLREEYSIKEYEFLLFDAMRHAAQCWGRAVRNKNDYGLMIMADHRFGLDSKITKLPKWIQGYIEKGNVGISIEMAMNISKHFYKLMAQPVESVEDNFLEEDEEIKILTK